MAAGGVHAYKNGGIRWLLPGQTLMDCQTILVEEYSASPPPCVDSSSPPPARWWPSGRRGRQRTRWPWSRARSSPAIAAGWDGTKPSQIPSTIWGSWNASREPCATAFPSRTCPTHCPGGFSQRRVWPGSTGHRNYEYPQGKGGGDRALVEVLRVAREHGPNPWVGC